MKVEYHPLTVSDLNNAVAYYNHSDSALESGFSEDRHAQIIYFSMIYGNRSPGPIGYPFKVG